MPVADVEKADVIVLVGCNPRHEMPLLGARIRKAARRGARIHAINPVDFDFDFEFALATKRIVAPDAFVDVLLDVVSRMNERKVSPILALVSPTRAKELTYELAERRQMPIPQ